MASRSRPLRQVPFLSVIASATGVSLFSQAIALLRQVLIVSSFGLSRDLDIYSTIFGLLSISVFAAAAIVESIFIALLTTVREGRGDDAVRRTLKHYTFAAAAFSAIWMIFLVALFPLVSLPFTAGFDAKDRNDLSALAISAMPWALLVIPYAAMGACLKCAGRFGHFFASELIVTVVSTLAIYLQHSSIDDVPRAYAIGYGAGSILLIFELIRQSQPGPGEPFPWREFLRRFLRHFSSNQLGTLGTLIERFWFSFLPAGGIGAIALVQQLMMSLSSLLSFREVYLVSLAREEGRAERLSRLLAGLAMLSGLAAVFVIGFAEPICSALFEYGKASARDVALLSDLLAIGCSAMVFGVVAQPVWRLQQMLGTYRPISLMYVAHAISMLLLGWLAVGALHWGARGLALVVFVNAAGACVAALMFARQMGARINAAKLRLVLSSWCLFLAAAVAARVTIDSLIAHQLLRLAAGAVIYGLFVGAGAYLARRKLGVA
jgi:peptidoglycan biosynthesis protein MviN/MurJ (putative lipid II flippase)